MPRYWYSTSSGALRMEAPSVVRAVGHYGYGLTPDLSTLPGPVQVCRWNGTAVEVDPTMLAALKARLRLEVEEKAMLETASGVLSTPWGDFRVRRDDIDAYQMIAFSAIYALQTSTPFSASLRRANDTLVTVTAGQFMQFINLIGERMAAKLTARDARLNQLAAATAEDLKGFAP